MAFKLVSSGGADLSPTMIELESSGSIAVGDILSFKEADSATQRLGRMTTNLGCYRVFGIAVNTVNSATGRVQVIPINEIQIWEADTTAATSVGYIGFTVATDTYAYLSGAAEASGTTGIFTILGNVGATSDNKVIGRFNRTPMNDV